MTIDYVLVGEPQRFVNGRKKKAKYYAQRFRILADLPRRVLEVSLKTADKSIARMRAKSYVEAKILKDQLKRDPQARTAANGVLAALDEYIENLRALGNTPKQCRLVKGRIERVITEAGWVNYEEADAVSAVKAISCMRDRGELRTLTTLNRYRECLRSWSTWMAKHGRWSMNLLESMPRFKGDTSPSRVRAVLSEEQLNHLIHTTKTGPNRRNLSGEDRCWLYAIASQSGLRAHELDSLTPSSFYLRQQPPYVEVHCTISKRRKTDRIELSADFAESLSVWLQSKPVDKRLWSRSRSWWYKASALLRADMALAGISDKVATPDGLAVIDFHSFRALRISAVVMTGANSRVIRAIARLSCEALVDR